MEELLKYLDELEAPSGPVRDRAKILFTLSEDLVPEKIESFFIDEYINQEGARVFEDLSFFTKSFSISVAGYLKNDGISVVLLSKRITGYLLELKDYDLKRSKDTSRMSITLFMNAGQAGILKASKSNCNQLVSILKKRIIPNLQEV